MLVHSSVYMKVVIHNHRILLRRHVCNFLPKISHAAFADTLMIHLHAKVYILFWNISVAIGMKLKDKWKFRVTTMFLLYFLQKKLT